MKNEPDETIVIEQVHKKPTAPTPVPAGQRRVRFKDTGKETTIGRETARHLKRAGRIEYLD